MNPPNGVFHSADLVLAAVSVLILVVILVLILIIVLIVILVLILVLVVHVFFLRNVLRMYRRASLPGYSGFILCLKYQAGDQAGKDRSANTACGCL